MADEDKKGLFGKFFDVLEASLDERLEKAKAPKMSADEQEELDEAFYRKSLYQDPSYTVGTQGYQEKTARLSFELLRMMAKNNTTVVGIIQTFQNKVAAFAKPVKSKYEKGFRIKPKNEEERILEIKKELFPEVYGEAEENDSKSVERRSEEARQSVKNVTDKTETPEDMEESADGDLDKEKLSEIEMDRIAREELEKQSRERIQDLQNLITTCGSLEERPFDTKRWNFDSFLRALTRDSLTYDWIAVERIEDKADRLHHWVPVDASTIRYATPQLKLYNNYKMDVPSPNILFPEKELERVMEHQEDLVELDEEKLANEEYKYVQVIRGKIERAFTEGELVVGMRNPTTDIYANGYSYAELELLLSIISSHIYTENYNKLYFSQGFSAKGILHVKANLTRRKLETLRLQWKHMVSGNRNSFQTPILAGMEEVQWIPLTQSHSDMEFDKWMNYLIKVICMVYQIDPSELGFGMRDEGGKGGGLSGDNTKEKMDNSRQKGLVPLLRYFERFINENIVSKLDPDYEFEFVGVEDESLDEATARLQEEVKALKTLNEARAELGLRPIEGADDLILEPTYQQWYAQFHPQAREQQAQMMEQNQIEQGNQLDGDVANMFEQSDEPEEASPEDVEKSLNKSLVRIETYEVKDD